MCKTPCIGSVYNINNRRQKNKARERERGKRKRLSFSLTGQLGYSFIITLCMMQNIKIGPKQ